MKDNDQAIPEQCLACLKRDACEEAGCLKVKPCRARAAPKKTDADLLEEIRWRCS